MSDSRIIAKLVRTPTTHTNKEFNLSLYCKMAWLFIFAQMYRVNSLMQGMNPAQFEALHLESNTWYQIVYSNESPFTLLPSSLNDDCNMIIGTPPANFTGYENAANLRCTWNNSPTGPNTEFNIEMNRTLSKELVGCVDGVMQTLCSIYNREHHQPIPHPPSSEPSVIDMWPIILGITGVSIFVCGLILIVKCVSSSNRSVSRPINDTYTPSYTSPCAPSYSHHHHHHDSDSNVSIFSLFVPSSSQDSSSSHSSSGGYQAESGHSGVSWGFTKTPH